MSFLDFFDLLLFDREFSPKTQDAQCELSTLNFLKRNLLGSFFITIRTLQIFQLILSLINAT